MKHLLMVAAAIALAGCANEQGELRAWMQEVRANTPPVRERIDEPRRFEPFRYDNVAEVDPFSTERFGVGLSSVQKGNGDGCMPGPDRCRAALAEHPLESIRMVGHLTSGRRSHALLQVDQTVFQARVGNYAGQNFGLITRISENEVLLKELVQDAAGDWVQRESALRLQEGGGK